MGVYNYHHNLLNRLNELIGNTSNKISFSCLRNMTKNKMFQYRQVCEIAVLSTDGIWTDPGGGVKTGWVADAESM
jgi:hypothetical protein